MQVYTAVCYVHVRDCEPLSGIATVVTELALLDCDEAKLDCGSVGLRTAMILLEFSIFASSVGCLLLHRNAKVENCDLLFARHLKIKTNTTMMTVTAITTTTAAIAYASVDTEVFLLVVGGLVGDDFCSVVVEVVSISVATVEVVVGVGEV